MTTLASNYHVEVMLTFMIKKIVQTNQLNFRQTQNIQINLKNTKNSNNMKIK